MRRKVLNILATLLLFACVRAQEISNAASGSERPALSSKELAESIFQGEQMTIAQVSKRAPIVESYIQSLNPEQTPEGLIDDAYFLGRIALDPDSGQRSRLRQFTSGKPKQEAPRIHVNTGDLWPLHPDGYVEMFFVDVSDFDSDHYSLRYAGTESRGEKAFLRVEVRPLDPKDSGRFQGDIWVDRASFRIVRIAGIFSPRRLGFASKYFNVSGISSIGLYFHFESWRQEVAPGIWLPSYTYFDEERSAARGNLTTSFHLRGHVWSWGYQNSEIGLATTNERPNSRIELERSGLLATPGQVELALNGIVEQLEGANGSNWPSIRCRVLLTTPAEIFSVDHTVYVSRGLLNFVPNQSVLAALMAREIAEIVLEDSRAPETEVLASNAQPRIDLPGLRIRKSAAEQAAINERMRLLLRNTQYADAVEELESFRTTIALYSRRIPHLMKPLFGESLLEQVTANPALPQALATRLNPSKAQKLELRGEHGVDSWGSRIVGSGQPDVSMNSVAQVPENTPVEPLPPKHN